MQIKGSPWQPPTYLPLSPVILISQWRLKHKRNLPEHRTLVKPRGMRERANRRKKVAKQLEASHEGQSTLQYTLFQNGGKYITLLSHCQLALVASIPSAEFKGIFGLKRGNKAQLTWRQKNNVFYRHSGLRCMTQNVHVFQSLVIQW